MKFNKLFMQCLADEDINPEEGEVVVNEVIETTRWSIIYYIVFKVDGKYFSSSYSRGATEMQDESPYEYEGDEIECDEVFPVERIVTEYTKEKP